MRPDDGRRLPALSLKKIIRLACACRPSPAFRFKHPFTELPPSKQHFVTMWSLERSRGVTHPPARRPEKETPRFTFEIHVRFVNEETVFFQEMVPLFQARGPHTVVTLSRNHPRCAKVCQRTKVREFCAVVLHPNMVN